MRDRNGEMQSSFGRYTHAIVSRLPNSFTNALNANDAIDLQLAREEQLEYTKLLRSLGLDVIELPADETLPDSPFVEDTAVVCNGIALICKPGHHSRAKEVETMRAIIKKELNLPIIEIADPKATLDGGDVLFTGREFFVGISKRTNESGACAVAAAFPEFPVTPIPVPNKLLHLKQCVSMAGPDIICVGSSPEAQSLIKKIEREATFRYTTLTVPDDSAANVLYINGSVVHRSEYPHSNEVFEQRIDYPRKSIKIWELSKPQALLTNLSILVKKSKSKKKI